MNILLREARPADTLFLERMHYEAVFWRVDVNKPSFEEGIAYPEVRNAMADWGERVGDTAVVATFGSTPVGAACYRFWTDDNFIRGYIDPTSPVLVIGVKSDYRRRGIGTKMIEWLVDRASKQAIHKISLSVSKDNHALNLYSQQGFLEYAIVGDTLLMVRNIGITDGRTRTQGLG